MDRRSRPQSTSNVQRRGWFRPRADGPSVRPPGAPTTPLVIASIAMLDSSEDKKREAFRAAVERAREDGLSQDDMVSMITAAAIETPTANGPVPPTEPDDVMYEPGQFARGPDRPAQRGEEVRDLRVSPGTLRRWVSSAESSSVWAVFGPSLRAGVTSWSRTGRIHRVLPRPSAKSLGKMKRA